MKSKSNKEIGIVTIIDNNNYGNRLQNYALSYFCEKKYEIKTITLLNKHYLNDRKFLCIRIIKNFIKKENTIDLARKEAFDKFNENIHFSKKTINCFSNLNKYDYLIVGSDQVWNPYIRRLRDVDVLKGTLKHKRISYAASFGVSDIKKDASRKIKKEIKRFKAISVREDIGKKIIENITNRNDIEVLIDPTMLLTAEEWDKVSKKPKMLKTDKYILNYFLGEMSEERKNEIDRIANENGCEVINILDKNSPYYQTGPSEFLYLEKNAFLICTDSFHSSVFAILYNRPFIVFDREDKEQKMNSRIETLINKFNLKNRTYEGKITKENLEHNYTEAYKILEREREKSKKFLEKALS